MKNIPTVEMLEDLQYRSRPSVELSKIISELPYYNLDAAYQRDRCWLPRAQKNLIRSILKGIPIGNIHLVAQTNDDFYSVLDAKQRLSSIQDFVANKFSVTWKGEEYFWNDLQLPKNIKIYRQFSDYPISVIEWKNISILQQRNLFEIINEQSTLNTAEKIYCPNFFSREIIRVFYNSIKKLAEKCRGEIQTNKRFSGIMWCHRICCLSFGVYFDDVFAVRKTDKSTLTKSARFLDTQLCHYLDETSIEEFNNSFVTESVLKNLGYYDQYENIKKLGKCMVNVLDHRNNLKKSENALDVTDMMVFLMEKIQQGILSTSMINDNLDVFFEFYKDYVNKKAEHLLAKHTTDVESINKRKSLFDQIYFTLPLDHGRKNREATPAQKASAVLSASPNCPLAPVKLTDNNFRVEHVNPKSKSSETDFAIVSDLGNSMKSNLTANNANAIKEYCDSH